MTVLLWGLAALHASCFRIGYDEPPPDEAVPVGGSDSGDRDASIDRDGSTDGGGAGAGGGSAGGGRGRGGGGLGWRGRRPWRKRWEQRCRGRWCGHLRLGRHRVRDRQRPRLQPVR